MHKVIICLFCIVVLFSCSNQKAYRAALVHAEELMDEHPDSSLAILDTLGKHSDAFDYRFRMQYLLAYTYAQAKNEEIFQSDTLTKKLVEYFESNGSVKEKTLSYYLHGCALTDIGHSPEALQAFYTSLDYVDTTKTDCDFNLLKGIYGQMSILFNRQNLPRKEIWALNHYIENVKRTSGERDYYVAKSMLVSPYFLLNETDTILRIIRTSYDELKNIGADQDAAIILSPAVDIYLRRGQLDKAREILEIYERESGLFNENGEIEKGDEGWYYYKGAYALAVNELGLAEKYFRSVIQHDYLSAGYKGLLGVYRKKKNADSVYHYSLLYEAAVDTLNNMMRTNAILQISSLYDYTKSQEAIEQEREKASRLQVFSIVICFLLILGLVFVIILYQRYQNKKRRELSVLKNRLSNAIDIHSRISEELKLLRSKDYERIVAEKEQREKDLVKEIEQLRTDIGAFKDITVAKSDNNLEMFLSSNIVKVIIAKCNNILNKPQISDSQWSMLVSQLNKDMPSLYKRVIEETTLSPLQQHVCILIVLGLQDAAIRSILKCSKTVLSGAKSRSNSKLFGQNDARSLKSNLLKSI